MDLTDELRRLRSEAVFERNAHLCYPPQTAMDRLLVWKGDRENREFSLDRDEGIYTCCLVVGSKSAFGRSPNAHEAVDLALASLRGDK
jgi:hypothetical protein